MDNAWTICSSNAGSHGGRRNGVIDDTGSVTALQNDGVAIRQDDICGTGAAGGGRRDGGVWMDVKRSDDGGRGIDRRPVTARRVVDQGDGGQDGAGECGGRHRMQIRDRRGEGADGDAAVLSHGAEW